MYKTIVVAIDGSETSIAALNEAINLTHKLHATLYIIHVIDTAIPNTADMGLMNFDLEKYLTAIRARGHALVSKMAAIASNVGIHYKVELIENTDHSRISEKILKVVEELEADLLVLGTHGRRGFHWFLIGSIAEDVVHMAKIPILLIRNNEQNRENP